MTTPENDGWRKWALGALLAVCVGLAGWGLTIITAGIVNTGEQAREAWRMANENAAEIKLLKERAATGSKPE